MQGIMFGTPKLEERFRRLITDPHEVGGFLIVNAYEPLVGSERDYKRAIPDLYWMHFIHSWLVVPNESANPQSSWGTRDFALCKSIADATARSSSYRMDAIHFHSHPPGSRNIPSKADMAFILRELMGNAYATRACVVSQAPMRLRPAYYYYNPRTGETDITPMQYFSWREKRFKALRNMDTTAGAQPD